MRSLVGGQRLGWTPPPVKGLLKAMGGGPLETAVDFKLAPPVPHGVVDLWTPLHVDGPNLDTKVFGEPWTKTTITLRS